MNNIKAGSVVFQNVRKTFTGFTAIPDLSLTIEPGTLVTLLGPSGCGKTTTLRMLAGLEHPSAGKILIGGKDVTMLPANERDVSMVFQSYALFPHMSAAENVGYGLESSGLSRKEAREKAEDGLALVGLAGMGNRLPAELSGGQQQRVAVARALVLEPQVLLLDEPTEGIQPNIVADIQAALVRLNKEFGISLVLTEQHIKIAKAMSDKYVVLDTGRIVSSGASENLTQEIVDKHLSI